MMLLLAVLDPDTNVRISCDCVDGQDDSISGEKDKKRDRIWDRNLTDADGNDDSDDDTEVYRTCDDERTDDNDCKILGNNSNQRFSSFIMTAMMTVIKVATVVLVVVGVAVVARNPDNDATEYGGSNDDQDESCASGEKGTEIW